MKRENNKIFEVLKPHLIICEGRDAMNYLIYFLQPLIKNDIRYDDFQVMDAEGISNIPDFIELFSLSPSFLTVKSVIIIRDSERDAPGASLSVQSALKNNGFATPSKPCEIAFPKGNEHNIKTAYALFPKLNSETENGTLEDLCLNTIANPYKELTDIVDGAVNQAKPLKRPHKNKLFTYLSLTDDYVGLKIGESARANAFDFEASDLEPLKMLLAGVLGE